jgi:hypothetical protein
MDIPKSLQNIMNLECKVCGFKTSRRGLMPHVKQKHNLSIDEYVKLYGEYRKKESLLIERSNNKFKCKILCATSSCT